MDTPPDQHSQDSIARGLCEQQIVRGAEQPQGGKLQEALRPQHDRPGQGDAQEGAVCARRDLVEARLALGIISFVQIAAALAAAREMTRPAAICTKEMIAITSTLRLRANRTANSPAGTRAHSKSGTGLLGAKAGAAAR